MSRRAWRRKAYGLLRRFSTASLKRVAKPRFRWCVGTTFRDYTSPVVACLIGQAVPVPGGRDDYASFNRSNPGVQEAEAWNLYDKEAMRRRDRADISRRLDLYPFAQEVGEEISKIAAEVLKRREASA